MSKKIELETNEFGKPVYKGVSLDHDFNDLEFHKVAKQFDDNAQYALHTNLGSLTVLDRMTGFGWRDIETGWRDSETGLFWLASGGFDVRVSGAETFSDAIEWVKDKANTCVGV